MWKRIYSLSLLDTNFSRKFSLALLPEQTLEFLEMSACIESCSSTLLHTPFYGAVDHVAGSTYAC